LILEQRENVLKEKEGVKLMSRLINYPNNQPVRIYTDLCRLYEKGDRSFYDVLDSLVKVLNKDQLNQIEDILVNKYGEL
tara:strand:+ start:376 stop:612 length:237 start_codon:yes stop_codon:yes gene_type:complete